MSSTTQTAGGVVLRGVSKAFGRGHARVVALDDVSVEFEAGRLTAIMGPSGSGKSTLLQCAGGLDLPDAGSVEIAGVDLVGLGEAARAKLRRDQIGFVFQSFNLLPALTAAQNVELPMRLARRRLSRRELREALAAVGLEDRARHRPSELSGGQQQRVAIARALVHRPAVLFADEPTGALDTVAARRLLALLQGLSQRERQTVVMVTHDPVAAAHAERVLFLADGRIVGEHLQPVAAELAAEMTRLDERAAA